MCSTRRLFELMSSARQLGLLVQVHCENGPLIDALTADAAGAGRRGAQVFAETRPPEVEEEAVEPHARGRRADRGGVLPRSPVLRPGGLDQVRLARGRGRPKVIAEACPHHLLLDDAAMRARTPGGISSLLRCGPRRTSRRCGRPWPTGRSTLSGPTIARFARPYPGVSRRGGPELCVRAGGHRRPAAAAAVRGPRPGAAHRQARAGSRGKPGPRLRPLPGEGRAVPGADADITVFDPAGQMVLGADGFGDGTGDSVYAGRRLARPHPGRPAGRAHDRLGQRAHRPRTSRDLPGRGPLFRPACLTGGHSAGREGRRPELRDVDPAHEGHVSHPSAYSMKSRSAEARPGCPLQRECTPTDIIRPPRPSRASSSR